MCKGFYLEPLQVPAERWAEEPFKVLLRTFFSESVHILKRAQKIDHHEDRKKWIQRSRLAGAEGLPDSVIDELTVCYWQNIRMFPKDGSVNNFWNLILSSYNRSTATDTTRQEYCHTSFCWIRRVEEKGAVPSLHSTKKFFLTHLSADLQKSILGVYANLTAPDLLQLYMRKMTQNPNESLHGKL